MRTRSDQGCALTDCRQLSTRARITATSFTNEYEWGDFKGSPDQMMQRYYDAHLYFANWGTHRIMLRLPRTLLDPEIAGQYCVDRQISLSASREHVILDLTSEDESGEWVEGAEDSLAAIVGVRSELAAGDLRPLYLAWLSAYGGWEGDEDAFGGEDEDELEPPVPAGLGSLTAAQRALADFLRLDADLLQVAAESSPGLPEVKDKTRAVATHIAKLPSATRTGFSRWSQQTRRQGPGWNCCETSAETQMSSGPPGPAGPSPNSSTRPRHAVCSTNSMPRPWPPPGRRSGNNSARLPGKGTLTNWPRTRRLPGPTPKG